VSARRPNRGADRRTASIPKLGLVNKHRVGLGTAELVPDPDRPDAWTLLVDGTPQSHVDLADPGYLEFEYVRWLGHLAGLTGPPPPAPINVLHLGGGAWTLARYVAATRPGSRQRVVELDEALVELVRERLPAPANAGIRVRIGEAREVLTGLTEASVDLLVTDVFAGARVPAQLTSVEFVAEAARVLRPSGHYAVNLADGAPLDFARGQVATIAAVFPFVAVVALPQTVRGRRFGNVVVMAARHPLPTVDLARRTASDPFPARVVAGEELARFTGTAIPVDDASAVPSPLPPEGLLEH
jgi:spermidine synthase